MFVFVLMSSISEIVRKFRDTRCIPECIDIALRKQFASQQYETAITTECHHTISRHHFAITHVQVFLTYLCKKFDRAMQQIKLPFTRVHFSSSWRYRWSRWRYRSCNSCNMNNIAKSQRTAKTGCVSFHSIKIVLSIFITSYKFDADITAIKSL